MNHKRNLSIIYGCSVLFTAFLFVVDRDPAYPKIWENVLEFIALSAGIFGYINVFYLGANIIHRLEQRKPPKKKNTFFRDIGHNKNLLFILCLSALFITAQILKSNIPENIKTWQIAAQYFGSILIVFSVFAGVYLISVLLLRFTIFRKA